MTMVQPTGAVIAASDLGKTFSTKIGKGIRRETKVVNAVQGFNLHVTRGEMVGFIGPNGAGKSTTIKMITGVLAPSTGNIRVLDLTPLTHRRQLTKQLGVVFGQRSQLWWDLPVEDSFSLLRHVYKRTQQQHQFALNELVELFELSSFIDSPVRSLSLGQRMRAEIAAALLHQPDLLVLDEPTIGLDVVAKAAVRSALSAMNKARNVTMLLTTHDLADIEQLCDRVVIIDHGRIVEDGPLNTVTARYGPTATLEEIVTTISRKLTPPN
jgi:ABC-2 type transport system ATP-binding protein